MTCDISPAYDQFSFSAAYFSSSWNVAKNSKFMSTWCNELIISLVKSKLQTLRDPKTRAQYDAVTALLSL